jgi:hypothetical protein
LNKYIFASLIMVITRTALAVDPPKFIIGFDYEVELAVTEDGTPFTYYTIEGEDFIPFKKTIMKYRKRGFSIDRSGLLWTYRKVEGWSVMTASGFGLKRFVIVGD